MGIIMESELLKLAKTKDEDTNTFVKFTDNQSINNLLNNLDEYPHAFVLGCVMDKQIPAHRAWAIPYNISVEFSRFDIDFLTNISLDEYKKLFNEKKYHRFNDKCAEDFYEAVHKIKNEYDGNASKIWSDNPSSKEVVSRFLEFKGVGPNIAAMAAKILATQFKIEMSEYSSIDVSLDVHVVRVMKRLFFDDDATDEQIKTKAREINPEFPGIIDSICFDIGRQYCRPENPKCDQCPLLKECKYNLKSSSSIIDKNQISLREDFQKVLDGYLDAKKSIGTINAPIANYITKDICEHLTEIVDSDKYYCESSVGNENLAEIPRIDFEIKYTENKNYIDVAYLFKSDMSGVYLVFRNFHNEDIEIKYGNYLPDYLKTKSKNIRDFIKSYGLETDTYEDNIDLLSNSDTAKLYTEGTIYSKFYEKSNIPSDEILVNDLFEFLDMFEIVLNNYSDNMYLTVDEWISALEDENLIDTRMLNVLEIMYNSKNHTTCFTDISEERHKLGYIDEKPMTYNTPIVYTSKRLKEHFNKTPLYNKKDKEEYWSRLFYGEFKKHENGKRLFYFTLREELIEALEKYDKKRRPDRIEIKMNYKTQNNEKSINYWLISAGYGAGWWDEFYNNNDVAIGFGDTGDLNQYESKEEIQQKLQEIFDDDTSHFNDALACWQFVHEMKIGDVIFVKNGMSEIIGRGIVESDYIYDTTKSYQKLRKVNWTHRGNWKLDETMPQKTLTNITYNPKLEKIKKLFEDKKYESFYDYLIDKGYYFDKETIENYLLSLKIKPFVILTGNSGTGKTKLSQLFAQYLNQQDNYRIIPVGANWTENRHILGYFNIIKNEAQYTPAYDLIKQAQQNSNPHFLILDEMNLSHVERYFADFLSAIESKETIPLHEKEELEIPDNLYIVGTVNVDETTYMFSPKVLDRANTIEFETYSAKDYMTGKFSLKAPKGNVKYLEDILNDHEIQDMTIEELEEVFNNDQFWSELSDEIFRFQEILKKSGFDFGFRVINEIVRFMAVAYKYENSPKNWTNWKRYFDAQIKQKMLPKLHGSQKIIGETLDDLLEACEDYPASKSKLEEMSDVLDKQRYVSFIN